MAELINKQIIEGKLNNENLVIIENPGYTKEEADEKFATKNEIPDVKNFVKDTDYATPVKAGLVKTQSSLGIELEEISGQISIDNADNIEIDNKANIYKPITPSNLDYAVKTSLTTNTIELTDEEKTNAKNWLGISSSGSTSDSYSKEEIDQMFNNVLTGKVQYLGKDLEDELVSKFDNKTVTGGAVKDAPTKYADANMIIEVKAILTDTAPIIEYGNKKGNGTLEIDAPLDYKSGETKAPASKMDDSSNIQTYVPTSARFLAELIRCKTGKIIVGIKFTRSK